MSFEARLNKIGDDYVITIPESEVERFGLKEGQLVEINIHPRHEESGMSDEVCQAFERSWKRSKKAYKYLSGR